MTKTIIIVRHERKDGEMIAANQIQKIIKNGIPAIDNNLPEGDLIIVHPGSALVRTQQTIEAWERNFISKYGESGIWMFDESLPRESIAFLPDTRFGSYEVFKKFEPAKTAFQETNNWLTALQEVAPELLEELKNGLMEALEEIFEWMDDSETIVMAGHTPMIEILAQGIDPDADVSPLAELEGFIFQQEDEGAITVKRVK